MKKKDWDDAGKLFLRYLPLMWIVFVLDGGLNALSGGIWSIIEVALYLLGGSIALLIIIGVPYDLQENQKMDNLTLFLIEIAALFFITIMLQRYCRPG